MIFTTFIVYNMNNLMEKQTNFFLGNNINYTVVDVSLVGAYSMQTYKPS